MFFSENKKSRPQSGRIRSRAYRFPLLSETRAFLGKILEAEMVQSKEATTLHRSGNPIRFSSVNENWF